MEKDFLADLMISKVHSIYHMYNAEGTKSRRINRPGWAVLLKYTGETTYRCNGEHIISNAGQMVILPKGCSYDWECTVSGHYYSIEFDWEQTCEHIFSFPISNCEKFLKIYKDLEYKRTLKGPFYELECIKGTYDIILKLLNSGGKPYAPASKQQKIQPAVDYIIQNYNTNISNDSLAALTSLSTVYFRKLFTEIYGMPPITYIHSLRIKKAKEMLLSDYSSISNIAFSLGYQNIYDFSRTFKKHTGVSPSNYLKQSDVRQKP